MTDKRVYREPLRQEWAEALLSQPFELLPDRLPAPETLFGMVDLSRGLLATAVENARQALACHPLAQVVADAAAKEAGKRGHATLTLDDTGTVMLEIHYGGKPVAMKRPPEPKKDTAKWSSKLPTLDELRAEAVRLGVDVSDLGRQKKRIIARLAEAKDPQPKPKRVKTAPALTPARVVTLTPDGTYEPPTRLETKMTTLKDLDEQGPAHPPEPDEPEMIPLDSLEDLEAQLAEPSELELDGDDDTPTDERTIEAAVEAKADRKVDLNALLGKAEDLDLDGILAKLEGRSDD